MGKEELNRMLEEVLSEKKNKVIDKVHYENNDKGNITLEITSGDYMDVFEIEAIELCDEHKEMVESNFDIRVRYLETLETDIGERFNYVDKVEGIEVNGESLELINLPTVDRLLRDRENRVYNHTMGLPFNYKLNNSGYIFSKTIHENHKNTDKEENIIFFFGPLTLNIKVDQNKKLRLI